jgi:hypothetical protein
MSLVMGVTSCRLMPGQRERTIFVASVRQPAGWKTARSRSTQPILIRRGDLVTKRRWLRRGRANCESAEVVSFSVEVRLAQN